MTANQSSKRAHTDHKTRRGESGFTRFRKDWIEPIVIALVLVFIIKTCIIQNFKIPSSSMEDTLLVGDRLFAVKFLYGIQVPFTTYRFFKVRDPRPNDVIVFKYPRDPSKDYIKRCIAVGGQSLEIKDKQVFVDNVLQKMPPHGKFIDNTILPEKFGLRDNYPPTQIPANNLFAMGDNRDNSNDSRFWGYVPYDNLKGKALFIYWSIDPDVPFYNVIHKIRWNRLLKPIR